MTNDNRPAADAPNPIDRHVGAQIRVRRRTLGVTQSQLAETLGVTFQQVQKYENGANRVSASRLWQVAEALQTSVAHFYEGLGEQRHTPAGDEAREAFAVLTLTTEGRALAEAFPRIRSSRLRRKLLELVRLLAEAPAEDVEAA